MSILANVLLRQKLDKGWNCKGVELLRENFQCSTFFPRNAHGYCNFAHGEPAFTAWSAFPHLVSNESAPPLIEDFGFSKGTKMDKKGLGTMLYDQFNRAQHHQSSLTSECCDFALILICGLIKMLAGLRNNSVGVVTALRTRTNLRVS